MEELMRFTGIATCLTAALALSIATAHAADPAKLRMGWVVAGADAPLQIFGKKGIATHEGVSYVLEPIKFAGTPPMVTALAAGEIDLVPFAYSTFALFVTNGLIALLAPVPPGRQSQGFDRTMLHRISMLAAAACMVAEIVLGIVTVERAGRGDQQDLAKAHLFVGYGTFAALAVGAGAMIF